MSALTGLDWTHSLTKEANRDATETSSRAIPVIQRHDRSIRLRIYPVVDASL
jgi:hypothetical protein